MTLEQFEDRFSEMLLDVNDALIEKAKHLFHSGAVDTDSYDDDMALPKIILCAALKDLASDYAPLFPGHIADLKNLENI